MPLVNQVIQLIKRYPPLYALLRYELYARFRALNRRRIYKNIYESNYWGDMVSVSGPGSSLQRTAEIRKALPLLIDQLGAKSLLDIPCGDLQWMRHVSLRIERYIGADIVASLIEHNRAQFGKKGIFLQLDLLNERLPEVDIIFCRDCLVHMSFREIRQALNNIKRSKSTYLLTTTFPQHQENVDTVSPYWRALNFELRPFNFPSPLCAIKDFAEDQPNDQGKWLGVWRTVDIAV